MMCGRICAFQCEVVYKEKRRTKYKDLQSVTSSSDTKYFIRIPQTETATATHIYLIDKSTLFFEKDLSFERPIIAGF